MNAEVFDLLPTYYQQRVMRWVRRGYRFEYQTEGREHVFRVFKGEALIGETKEIFRQHAISQALTLIAQREPAEML